MTEAGMKTGTPVPVQITPEAEQHVAALGRGGELERMIEHAGRTMAGLRHLRVTLEQPQEESDEPRVVLWAYKGKRGPGHDPAAEQFGAWKVNAFPPDVCRHFVLLTVFGDAPGGR
jgi:hypothetical protein